MRILLTGASGFLGRPALEALRAAGHHVVAVARRIPADAPPADWRVCDLLEAGAAAAIARSARAQTVLHLAWCAQAGVFWTDPANELWVQASIALARAALDAGASRVCAAGTSYEYDWPADGECHEASTALAGHTPYDRAKALCRQELAKLTQGHGLAWARLFYFYGPREDPKRLVASVARALVAGQAARCSSGLAVRDYMDGRDAGAALAALAMSSVIGDVNIGSGHGVSVAQIARTLGRLAGRPDLVRLGALPDRVDEPPRIVADVSRLAREVGVAPARSLEQGLADCLAYWRGLGEGA